MINYIGYSSTDFQRDITNGINIIGPSYEYTIETFKKKCEQLNILDNIKIILNLKYIYIDYLKHIKVPAKSFVDLNSKSLILDTKFIQDEINKLCEYLKRIDIIKKIYGFYFYEEPRQWVKYEINFIEHCIKYIKEYFFTNNIIEDNIKYIIYHPNHLVDEQEITKSYTIESRILSVKNYNYSLFALYVDFNNTSRIEIIHRLKYYYLSNLQHVQKNVVLQLTDKLIFTNDELYNIIFHDVLSCGLFGMYEIFLFRLYYKNKSNFTAVYDNYIKARNEINKLKFLDSDELLLSVVENAKNKKFFINYNDSYSYIEFTIDDLFYEYIYKLEINSSTTQTTKNILPLKFKITLTNKKLHIHWISLFFYLIIIIFNTNYFSK